MKAHEKPPSKNLKSGKKPVSNTAKWLPILNSVLVQFKNFPKPAVIKVTKVALKAGLNSGKAYKHLRAGTAFAVVFVAMSGALFYLTDTTVAYVTADIQGQSGQWTTQTLPDGSRLILRGKSAVNLDFKTNQRVVELVQGQIYVDVAKDKTRPF